MDAWILTYNRPNALNRLIKALLVEGLRPNVLSNHPDLKIEANLLAQCGQTIINTLNEPDSASWCSRSWNSIFIKAFRQSNEACFIQDDTNVNPGFGSWIRSQSVGFDFVWGPVGDQFWYMRQEVLAKVGWFDERYAGCYCQDADFLRRVWLNYDRDRISVEEHHHWGGKHQPCGQNLFVNVDTKALDGDNYVNQHIHFRDIGLDSVMGRSEAHFRWRWGHDIGDGSVLRETVEQNPNLDWYPWYTQWLRRKNV